MSTSEKVSCIYQAVAYLFLEAIYREREITLLLNINDGKETSDSRSPQIIHQKGGTRGIDYNDIQQSVGTRRIDVRQNDGTRHKDNNDVQHNDKTRHVD